MRLDNPVRFFSILHNSSDDVRSLNNLFVFMPNSAHEYVQSTKYTQCRNMREINCLDFTQLSYLTGVAKSIFVMHTTLGLFIFNLNTVLNSNISRIHLVQANVIIISDCIGLLMQSYSSLDLNNK